MTARGRGGRDDAPRRRRPGTDPRPRVIALRQALDEARFGALRTLNLRAALPTPRQALARAESWLREKQVARAGEVLIITGRGNASFDGISVVREAIVHLFAQLRRRGVVSEVQEHTPGSFVVRLAPVAAMLAAPRRHRDRHVLTPADPAALGGLSPATLLRLRALARRALLELGVRETPRFVEAEMLAQFAAIAGGVPEGVDRDTRLRVAIEGALTEYDDA